MTRSRRNRNNNVGGISTKHTSKRRFKFWYLFVGILLVLFVVFIIYIFFGKSSFSNVGDSKNDISIMNNVNENETELSVNQATSTKMNNEEVLGNLFRHFDFGTVSPDSNISIGVVDDVDLLRKDNNFFDRSIKGDILIIYDEKVILYRPTSDKVINFSIQPTQSVVSSMIADVSSNTTNTLNSTSTPDLIPSPSNTISFDVTSL